MNAGNYVMAADTLRLMGTRKEHLAIWRKLSPFTKGHSLAGGIGVQNRRNPEQHGD
jgi:hypothetical protein